MDTVIIVIHLMVIVALVAVVLMQRSEGGALGIGGAGNFLSTRGQGNLLTRTTAILAAAFFVTSIALTVYARLQSPPSSVLEQIPGTPPAPVAPTDGTTPSTPSTSNGSGILDELETFTKGAPPAGGNATTPAPAVPATPPSSDASGAATSGETPAPAAPATPEAPKVPTSQ